MGKTLNKKLKNWNDMNIDEILSCCMHSHYDPAGRYCA